MRVMLDACVLYPTVMREVLLGCAAAGLYEPRWTPRILEEWARATVKLGPGAETIARGEIASLAARFPKAMIEEKQGVAIRLWLPDPDDIHVLAAAIGGSCDAIVTMNASDFPRNVLAEEGLERLDPDNFVLSLRAVDSAAVDAVALAVLTEARRLSSEPWTMRGLMKKARLPRLGKALSELG